MIFARYADRRTRRIAAIAAILLVPCGLPANVAAQARGASAPTTIDRTNRSAASVLKDIFVRAGTIDGRPIKDFRLQTRCTTAFVTAGGTIVIDWRHVGNFAGHDAGNREVFPIDDGHGAHDISVPAGKHPEPLGNSGARVDSGLSSLADGCAAA